MSTPFPSLAKAVARTDREFLDAARQGDKATSQTLRWGEAMLEEVNLSERIAASQKQKFNRKKKWIAVEMRLRELAIKNSVPQPATLADVKFVCETRHQNPKSNWATIAYAVLIPACRIVRKLADGKKVVHQTDGITEDRSGADQIALVLDDARRLTVQGFRKTWSVPSSTDQSKAVVNAVEKLAKDKYAALKAYAKVIASRGDALTFLKILQKAVQPPQKARTRKQTASVDVPAAVVFDGENRIAELLTPSAS